MARYYDAFLFTYAFSVVGLPAISVPAGFTSAGLPVGLQIVGRRLRDDAVLEAAAALAALTPEHYRRPPIEARPASGDLGGDLVTPGFTLTWLGRCLCPACARVPPLQHRISPHEEALCCASRL